MLQQQKVCLTASLFLSHGGKLCNVRVLWEGLADLAPSVFVGVNLLSLGSCAGVVCDVFAAVCVGVCVCFFCFLRNSAICSPFRTCRGGALPLRGVQGEPCSQG